MSNPDPPVESPVPPSSAEEDPVLLDFLTPQEYQLLLQAEISAFQTEYEELLQQDPDGTLGRQEELVSEMARIEALLNASPGA